MKLIIKYEENEREFATITQAEFTMPPGLDVFDMAEVMRSALLAIGYHPNSVAEAFNDDETHEDGL